MSDSPIKNSYSYKELVEIHGKILKNKCDELNLDYEETVSMQGTSEEALKLYFSIKDELPKCTHPESSIIPSSIIGSNCMECFWDFASLFD